MKLNNTEQPGDKETSNAITEIAHDVIKRHQTPYFAAVAAATEGIQYERTKAPALLSEVETLRAENERLREEIRQDTVRHVREATEWKEATESVSKQNEILDLANQQLERVINELQSENAKQAAELEQLRSERDKMKSDCDAWKGMIVPILDFAHQHGKQLGIRPGESIPEKVLEILKSALSGGSKQ